MSSTNTDIPDMSNLNTLNLKKMSMSLLLSVVVIFVLFLFVVQYCWNNTISVLTNTKQITIWQSLLLLVLFHILFNNGCYVQK